MLDEPDRRRERPTHRWSGVLAFAFVVVLSRISASASESPSFLTTGDSTRVSVVADGVSLPRILREVADVAGIRLVVEPALEAHIAEQSVTITIEDLRPEAALRKLLPGSNLLLVYASDGALVEVQAYGAGDSPATPRAGLIKPAKPASRPAGSLSVKATAPEVSPPTIADDDRLLRERLRRDALTHAEPARRAAALEELTGISDEAVVRETATAMLGRERDAKVLEATLDVMSTLKTIPLESIAQFAAVARAPELRIQALDILGDRAKEDTRVRMWLQSLSSHDGDEDVRNAARMLLDQGESK
jgi:hypothetical protein